ncbi:MAG: type II secretion system F family protein [Campylobacterota bacterium]|nr:type II secretion system F family protein [Campylobacterota bacterium]
MQFYIIYALDETGNKVIDGFEVENRAQLYKVFETNFYTPIKIYDVPSKFSFIKPIFTPKISTEQVIEMLDGLNIILRAGIPINQGLEDIKEDATSNEVKKLITRVSNEVSAGTKLSVACKPYQKYFTSTIINLMAIGEETGKLSTTLENGADFLRKTEALKKNTKKALFTPIISLLLIFLAVAAWMTFVVPGMVDFFKDMDAELPPLTVFLIDASAFTTAYLGDIIIGLIVSVIAFNIAYKKIAKFRYKVLSIMLKVPLFSKMMRYFNIAFIMEYLQLSVNSGLTLYESLILLRESIENDIYKEDIELMIKELEKGVSMSETTRGNTLYTNFVTRVLEIGETTGSINIELQTISSIYYEKVDDLSALIPKVVQPITMLIGGGFMAMIMMGLLGPIYDLIGSM